MALSSKDTAAVKKAAAQGGLSSSQGNAVVKSANSAGNVSSKAPMATAATVPGSYGIDKKTGMAIGPENDTPRTTGGGSQPNLSTPDASQPTDPAQLPPMPPTSPTGTSMQGTTSTITDPLTGQAFSRDTTVAGSQYQPNKYQQALKTVQASGIPAPSEGGVAKMQTQGMMPNQQDTSMVDSFISQDPNVNTLMQGITQLLNPQKQATTLMQDYQKLYKQSGLDEINHELIDADTVINGTEQDIRNEIQTAGGFGTESQVQAMSLARNKGLLTRYNQLVQQKTDATNQLNTLSSLNAQDKQMAQTRLSTQINAMFSLANFQQQAQKNTQEAFNNMVDKVGYSGAYAAYSQDPRQLANLEKVMGLQSGGLYQLSQQSDLDRELKVAQINSTNRANQSDAGITDPAQLIAYAQQYASTGQIPTGLPKGAFGLISQYAKETPKPDGSVVDRNTGVKSSKLSSTQEDGVATLKDLTQKLDGLKSAYNDTSLLSSTAQRQSYVDQRNEVVDLLARLRTGAVINTEELNTYQAKLPELFGITQGSFFGANRPSVGNQKIDDLKGSLGGKLNTILDTNGLAMYGYTPVKLGGSTYKVGDVISVNGVTGRVLPDGSVSVIGQ